MILWHDLNFWTAVGQMGIGILAGMMIGAIIRRARRMSHPPAIPSKDRMCPACGAPALRRVRGGSPRRLFSALTGRWSYACSRCNWPAVSRPVGATRPLMARSEQAESGGRTPLAPRTIAPRVVAPHAPSPVRPAQQDDATQVKDAVFHYLALLNAGDIAARANCYLSEFTSFDADGEPLKSSAGVDWRAASMPLQAVDLRCRDLRVYIHKDTAIATAYLVGTVATSQGAATRVSGRSSWVHLRQNGVWKIAHTHLSPLNPEASY